MKRKHYHPLAAVFVTICAVSGLTACQNITNLPQDLVEQAVRAIPSAEKSSSDSEINVAKEDADHDDAVKTDIAEENGTKKSITEKNMADTDTADADMTNADIIEESTKKGTAEGNTRHSPDLGIYIEEPPWFPENPLAKPIIITEYDKIYADEENYPQLSQALETFNAECAASAAAWENENWESAQEARQYEGEDYPPFIFQGELSVMRADQQAVGILRQEFWNTGGLSRASSAYYSKNIHPMTGKEIVLEEVVADIPRLASVLVNEFEIQRPEPTSRFDYLDNAADIIRSQFQAGQPKENQPIWVLGYHGITFYYNSDVLTLGECTVEITVLFSKYPDLFQPAYQKEPEEFALHLKHGQSLNFDFDHDGRLENLYVSNYSSNNLGGEAIQIFVEGLEPMLRTESNVIFVENYLLKNTDGIYYLYVETFEVDEVSRVLVFKLTGNEITYQGEQYGSIYGYMIPKPSQFTMGFRIGALGYHPAYRHYHMGKNGLPEADDEMYYFPELQDYDLDGTLQKWYATIIRPVPARKIFEDGTISSTEERIPVGLRCFPVQTDNQSFLDIELEDGRRYRLEYQAETWHRTIHGIEESQYFDGIVYAG